MRFDPFKPADCTCDALDGVRAQLEGREAHLCLAHDKEAIEARAHDVTRRDSAERAARLKVVTEEFLTENATPALGIGDRRIVTNLADVIGAALHNPAGDAPTAA